MKKARSIKIIILIVIMTNTTINNMLAGTRCGDSLADGWMAWRPEITCPHRCLRLANYLKLPRMYSLGTRLVFAWYSRVSLVVLAWYSLGTCLVLACYLLVSPGLGLSSPGALLVFFGTHLVLLLHCKNTSQAYLLPPLWQIPCDSFHAQLSYQLTCAVIGVDSTSEPTLNIATSLD